MEDYWDQMESILPGVARPGRYVGNEIHAIRKSYDHLQEEQLTPLRSMTEQMKALQHEPDLALKAKKAIELDRAFHMEICRLANNNYMNRFHRQLMLQFSMSFIHEKTYQAVGGEKYYKSHADIIEWLSQKKAHNAIEALKQHFNNVKVLFNQWDALNVE